MFPAPEAVWTLVLISLRRRSVRQEYGISRAEKLDIAQAYCVPLMKKIQLDLQRTHEDEAVNKLHPL